MRDIQSGPADLALAIDRVGVKNLELPIVARDRARGRQHTVARVDIGADLPALFKGTHMSRFVEALDAFSEELDYYSIKRLLADVLIRLDARRAYAVFEFPYFIQKTAPATGSPSVMSYACRVVGELAAPDRDTAPTPENLEKQPLAFDLEVKAPVMTVCPCSKAISDDGAHSQRAEVRLRVRPDGFIWVEELVEIAENAASSPVYTLLKRQDEKAVTENAFAKPTFVEDVVRAAAHALSSHPRVAWYGVEVESFESIHNHSAYAGIRRETSHTIK